MHVIYSDLMVAPVQGSSPSAAKPRPVVEAWIELDSDIRIVPPVPATIDDFARAHDRSFVEHVFAQRIPNGFGTRSTDVNRSLPYTTGAMLTAARLALDANTAVAAPVSGFHHARWSEAAGYCTFNGLMVAALALREARPGIRVGILDYDYHYGDGTDDILHRLGLTWLTHYTAGQQYLYPDQADAFLDAIPDHVARMAQCDVVLYQAGADPHIDDPLGGFLTTAELAERDRRVFQHLHDRGIPVAWNLAGGYQQPLSKVVAIHKNTYRACKAIYTTPLPSRAS
jgi:acetoin utilization deacetylase AcuC-like enzyme